MVALHAGILAGSLLEASVAERGVSVPLAATAAAAVLAANVLRIAAIRSLGTHWNVRVVDSTALGVVSSGPYRFVRHPNYVAVFLELLFLPLVQGAWVTALLGALVHGVVLRRRIALEESVLLADARYVATMGDKPRFFPRFLRRASRVEATEEA
jgi:methyltransferase